MENPDPFIFGSPEEVKEALVRRVEEQRLIAEEHTRSMDEFVEGLPEEHLKLLQVIIRQCAQNPDFGQYLNGWVSHMLKAKFSICQFCGGKHETPEDWIKAHADNLPGVSGPAPWMKGHPDEY